MTRPTRCIPLPAARAMAAAALIGFLLLWGCGGNGGGPAAGGPAVDALSNPEKIVFASGRTDDSRWRFFTMNPDGSGVVQLPMTINARLSAGGHLNRGGTIGILDFDFGTGAGVEHDVFRLSDGAKLFSEAHFSFGRNPTAFTVDSTGAKLAGIGPVAASDTNGIYRMNIDGTGKTLLAPLAADLRASQIRFAPDDATLFFVASTSSDFRDPAKLYKLAPGSSTPVVVADPEKPISALTFSLDGTKLGFVSVSTGASGAPSVLTSYTINADGTGLAKSADISVPGQVFSLETSVAARMDGFHILYAQSQNLTRDIYDVRFDGTGTTQLTYNAAGNDNPISRSKHPEMHPMMSGFSGMVGVGGARGMAGGK